MLEDLRGESRDAGASTASQRVMMNITAVAHIIVGSGPDRRPISASSGTLFDERH